MAEGRGAYIIFVKAGGNHKKLHSACVPACWNYMASMVSAFHHTRLYITNEILLQHQVVSDCAFALHALEFGTEFRNYYRDVIREAL